MSPDISDKCKFCFQTEPSKCIFSPEERSRGRRASAAASSGHHKPGKKYIFTHRKYIVGRCYIDRLALTLQRAGHVKYSSGKHLCAVSARLPQNFLLSFSMAW